MARGLYTRTRYVDASIPAFVTSIEAFNSPTNPYRYEGALILGVNAIELLSKALLLKLGSNINDGNTGRTISAEKALNKIYLAKEITEIEHETLQQIVSLRNEAAHSYLGKIDSELMLYLFYALYKYFEKIIRAHFKAKSYVFKDNFLSISTDQNRTYADSVIGLFKSKREADRRILYLLERGVLYDGKSYVTQAHFEKELRKNKRKRLENRAAIGEFLNKAEMLRIIFVQAPKHYSVDVTLGKNKRDKNILPVNVITRLEHSKNTVEIAELAGVSQHEVVKFIKDNKIKENASYHQEIPNGKNPALHRYSEKLADLIKKQ